VAIPESILVHTAVALTYDEPQSATPEWIEGEPGPQAGAAGTQGRPFACVLFLPAGGGEVPDVYRSRVVLQPTLLFNPTRPDGSAVTLLRESDVLVTAPELAPYTGGVTVRWGLVGVAQPFGPPGQVIGVQATLQVVED
jgi:hypothetical protein